MRDSVPICPVCGEECSWIYKQGGEVIGCNNCVEEIEAWNWLLEEEENESWAECDRRFEQAYCR